jgi:hypothetical protein
MVGKCVICRAWPGGCPWVRSRLPEGEVTVLTLNKKLLAAAGAVVTAVSLTVTGVAAAAAGSSTKPRTEFFQLMSTSATSSTSQVIARGVFTDYGVDHTGNKVDAIVLQKGSFKIAHSAGTGTQRFNPRTCLARINLHGTYRIVHGTGTGKYAGIRGHGTYHLSILFIAARAGGKCSQSKPPVAFQQIIKASGPVRLR